jgi:hypothetical protein
MTGIESRDACQRARDALKTTASKLPAAGLSALKSASETALCWLMSRFLGGSYGFWLMGGLPVAAAG